MTPEELRKAHIDAIAGYSPYAVEVSPVEAYNNLLAHLDQHQPFTAKLLREGDPEGFLAEQLRIGSPVDWEDLCRKLAACVVQPPYKNMTGLSEIMIEIQAAYRLESDLREAVDYPEPIEQSEAVES